MRWQKSWKRDPRALKLADRHYNRTKPGSLGFGPPGRSITLCVEDQQEVTALWMTVFPRFSTVWINNLFRNEGIHRSSKLIIEAIACSKYKWADEVPSEGIITYVNPKMVRKKRDPGRCYKAAGFIEIGETGGGLLIFQMKKEDMPEAQAWKQVMTCSRCRQRKDSETPIMDNYRLWLCPDCVAHLS